MTNVHSSTGGYALNALDRAELVEFEAHLSSCPPCEDEVTELCATAAELAVLTLATPPPTLRDTILATIRTTSQVPAINGAVRSASPLTQGGAVRSTPPAAANGAATPPLTPNGAVRSTLPPTTRGNRSTPESLRAARSSGPRRAALEHEVSEREAEPESHRDELVLRRQRRRTRVLSGLVAAMLALAVGLGGVVYVLVQDRQAQVAQIALEEELYSAPDAVTTTAPLPGGGQVTFIASKQLNRALFLGTDLPDPGQNRYQLWTATGTDLRNITGVSRDVQVADTDSGVKVFFRGNVAGADFLAVNLERAGSTPAAPTNSVLAAGPTAV